MDMLCIKSQLIECGEGTMVSVRQNANVCCAKIGIEKFKINWTTNYRIYSFMRRGAL